MKKDCKGELENLFEGRVKLDEIERRLYSRDSASLPQPIERFVDNVPEAVVQPVSTSELTELCQTSRRHSMPLVPRGGGTSGYGGAIPAESGIVVDFSRMNEVLGIDEEEKTVTVQPGVIWENLATELEKRGLYPEIMPSSAPGATVAGWVAEGGAGIGSFQNGYVRDGVKEVELVKPDGEITRLGSDGLDLVSGAEGITGFISEVTMEVDENSDLAPKMVSFDSLDSLSSFLEIIRTDDLPLWHVGISNSNYIASQGKAKGNEVPGGQYFTLMAFRSPGGEKVLSKVDELAENIGGTVLSDDFARDEWEDRFYPLRMKQLGPSLVPSEGVVPFKSMTSAVEELENKYPNLALEGHFAGSDELTLLTFMLTDERAPAYTFDFSKSLNVLKTIVEHEGKPYSTGLYLTEKADQLLGEERVKAFRDYKKKFDPDELFNPGKLIPSQTSLLDLGMKIAENTEPAIEAVSKFFSDNPSEGKELPSDLNYNSFSCVNCGYCRDVCSLFDGRGWESSAPRGKFNFLKDYMRGKVEMDQEMVDTFLLCTTCKRCDDVCQAGIPIQEEWDEIRGYLVDEKDNQTFPAFEMMKGSYGAEKNIWAEKASERDTWVPDEITPLKEGEVGYWAGCTASFLENDIAKNGVRILDEGGVEFSYLGQDEGCCGIPFLTSGKWGEWENALRYNISEIKERGIEELVTSCPGCYIALDHYYDEWAEKLGLDWNIEVKHITEVASDLVKNDNLKFTEEQSLDVTWHDPCHIGRHAGIYEPPREVLEALPGVELKEMEHNREDGLCCGSVLTRVGEPKTSDEIAASRLEEAEDTGAGELITTCPCCEFQLRVGGLQMDSPMPVKDFSTLVAKSLGYESENPTQDVYEGWYAFEAMIYQMSLPGMVEMMEELLPEMMEEMPSYMQKGMDQVGYLPGRSKEPMFMMMKRAMPYMMPRLMDDIMPKMVPQISEYLKHQVPHMSDSMEEMMPELLPEVMEAILPAMLPDVLEQVKPEMMEEIRDRVSS
ncbi:FAD-binding oxidoreductase [Candidatus Bipolaricaulota bacterium]|nr:FAD-binding oxidoreductase [Candidatus Bipolaricaulota bacterium]